MCSAGYTWGMWVETVECVSSKKPRKIEYKGGDSGGLMHFKYQNTYIENWCQSLLSLYVLGDTTWIALSFQTMVVCHYCLNWMLTSINVWKSHSYSIIDIFIHRIQHKDWIGESWGWHPSM